VERLAALQKDLAAQNGSLAEIALRFTISDPAVSTVIPGMRTVRNVERNAAVSEKGPLDAATLQLLKRHAWAKNFYN
jgi:aryl-alcohol dehydrogenase-like predicted oxidoreductase